MAGDPVQVVGSFVLCRRSICPAALAVLDQVGQDTAVELEVAAWLAVPGGVSFLNGDPVLTSTALFLFV
jgi:hypothetical protein